MVCSCFGCLLCADAHFTAGILSPYSNHRLSLCGMRYDKSGVVYINRSVCSCLLYESDCFCNCSVRGLLLFLQVYKRSTGERICGWDYPCFRFTAFGLFYQNVPVFPGPRALCLYQRELAGAADTRVRRFRQTGVFLMDIRKIPFPSS